MTFEHSSLPYLHDALTPFMSVQTLELHHGKHHQTYVTTLNRLIQDTPLSDQTLDQIVINSYNKPEYRAIFNNAGQHWNHTLFWSSMKPGASGSGMPEILETRIINDFGSVEAFKKAFIDKGLTQFGSGWCWLVIDATGHLIVTNSPNAENPLIHGHTALLGCDVWEHSYYLDYQNRRNDYLIGFLDNLVDWDMIAHRLQAAS